jgi:lipopolysaccharide export system permease protein
MSLLDRVLIRAYLKAYLVCLVSLLGLYIVVDLFTNLEDFTDSDHHRGLMDVLQHIGTYYGYKVSQIFDRLCEAIVLLAAMFTVAWMQRHNEVLPLLSAGVSVRRVVRPVLLAACLLLGLSVANQELIIPRIGRFLVTDRDDPMAEKPLTVQGAFEPNEIHIEGDFGYPTEHAVKRFRCTLPERVAGGLLHLTAKEARYFPPGATPRGGGWLLTDTSPPELDMTNPPLREVVEFLDPGKYFLRVQEVDFDVLTRNRTWFNLASTTHIRDELAKPESTRLAAMAVLFHTRLTRPVLGVILVLLGLSVILRDQNRNVFISAGLCLLLCGLFFAATFACKHLGDHEYLSPALAAWLPVLTFGPLSLVLFDAAHT